MPLSVHASHSPEILYDRTLVWLRRDLRLSDQVALSQALRHSRQVLVCFLFDREILDPLPRADRRVEFIVASLQALDAALHEAHPVDGVGLICLHGTAREQIAALARELGVQAVFANHDDEPQALARDALVRGQLAAQGMALHTFKDHVVFERQEVLTQSGRPFAVFTPYRNAWLKKLQADDLQDLSLIHI